MDKLALLGGKPVLPKRLPAWSWPPRYSGQGDVVKNYVDGGQPLSIQGREGVIAGCEDELKRRLHRRHAILCSSGTMAIYSAWFALGISPGDEVICTTITYHATATPALHLGAKVVLVDVEPDTGNIAVNAVENAITSRTRAVATNALWGHPVEQQRIRALCDQHRLAWLEDFSHAHFSEYLGRPVGSWGDVACASLQGGKFISGGEGGVLVTDSDAVHDRAVLLGHNLKRSETCVLDPQYQPISRTGYGLKLRSHPLAAALIYDQLVHYADDWILQRKHSLERLSQGLAGLEGLRPPVVRDYVTSMGAWYGYKPWIDFARLGVTRERLVEALKAENLEVDIPGSPPLHKLPIFDPDRFPINGFEKHDNRGGAFPNAESYSAGILSLPTFTGSDDEFALTAMIHGFRKVWDHLNELR